MTTPELEAAECELAEALRAVSDEALRMAQKPNSAWVFDERQQGRAAVRFSACYELARRERERGTK